MKVKTRFETIQDVTYFVEQAKDSPKSVWVTRAGSRICVDGKSLMGMFSIDPTTEFIVETEDSELVGYIMQNFPDESEIVTN